MVASTGAPALTMSIILRGFFNEATNSSGVYVPMIVRPLALPSTKSFTL